MHSPIPVSVSIEVDHIRQLARWCVQGWIAVIGNAPITRDQTLPLYSAQVANCARKWQLTSVARKDSSAGLIALEALASTTAIVRYR
jgi:hypothetical protein